VMIVATLSLARSPLVTHELDELAQLPALE